MATFPRIGSYGGGSNPPIVKQPGQAGNQGGKPSLRDVFKRLGGFRGSPEGGGNQKSPMYDMVQPHNGGPSHIPGTRQGAPSGQIGIPGGPQGLTGGSAQGPQGMMARKKKQLQVTGYWGDSPQSDNMAMRIPSGYNGMPPRQMPQQGMSPEGRAAFTARNMPPVEPSMYGINPDLYGGNPQFPGQAMQMPPQFQGYPPPMMYPGIPGGGFNNGGGWQQGGNY